MLRTVLALSVCLVASYAFAGMDSPPQPIDLSQFDTPAQRSAAITAQSAIDQALIPQPCTIAPLPDTLIGTAGVASPCLPRSDAARPTVVQATSVPTDTNGNWAINWSKPFSSSTYYVNPQPAYSSTPLQPYVCNVNMTTQTPTFVQGKCWQLSLIAIPAIAIGAPAINLSPSGAAATIQVRVGARDTTQ